MERKAFDSSVVRLFGSSPGIGTGESAEQPKRLCCFVPLSLCHFVP
jgi:hypothetical protein